ncbi:MAG: Asp-tRNA(Asn)/Glu-tRNA(Gln) amidotransferase subunit GatC [Clostridia bacterium]|nr:Asp-tRNA(Asn)/Glu-tRNA(Gln) amidotransferase subunit GatC [Clostridia bacterium]
MKLEIEDIKHLANLSALEFEEERLEKFKDEFNSILGFVDQISSADVDGDLEYSPVDVEELREDKVRESFAQEKILENAPKQKMGCFAVPLMME